jgi:hypothetical protein
MKFADEDDQVFPVEAEAPDHWVVSSSDLQDEDYLKTKAVGRELVSLRMKEIMKERGIDSSLDPDRDVWRGWKSSSTSMDGKALQLAAANELHGVHRFTPEEVAKIEKQSNQPALQAYVRAQWETNQFLLDRAGMNDLKVYRGLMIPHSEVEKTKQVQETSQLTKLPEITLERNGAASTSFDASVANNWNGVDLDPKLGPYDRVVVRLSIPRTAVLSLPVFGHNLKAEKEVVIAGTRERWLWDAWKGTAPSLHTPIH